MLISILWILSLGVVFWLGMFTQAWRTETLRAEKAIEAVNARKEFKTAKQVRAEKAEARALARKQKTVKIPVKAGKGKRKI